MARVGTGGGGYKKKDRYGVRKHTKSGARRSGSKVMRGKSAGDAMYVYNRSTGSYTKKSKAQVKKLDVGTAASGAKYKLVSERTFNEAKKSPNPKASPSRVRANRKARKTEPVRKGNQSAGAKTRKKEADTRRQEARRGKNASKSKKRVSYKDWRKK